jgi:3-dehydroquinate dehydratase / shikimate dehydrogenase
LAPFSRPRRVFSIAMIAPSKICAVVAAADAKAALRQLDQALRVTGTVELRLDYLKDDREITRFLDGLAAKRLGRGSTLIATCRRVAAGGKYRGSAANQLICLAEALSAGCTWYDLDIETASIAPRGLVDVLVGEGRQLLSAHYFQKGPASFRKAVGALAAFRPDAAKIAVQTGSIAESVKVIDLARGRSNFVAVPMGEAALPARVLALRHGSALAFAPVEQDTAPGQVPLEVLSGLYRADKLTRKTRVYGVIGDPIGHSLSPRLHNAGFQGAKIDAVFLPFLVRDLKDFLSVIRPLGIRGFAVTLPHKQAIMRHLDSVDPMAKAIGAVNTVSVSVGGKLHGLNTDYVGVLRALEKRMPFQGSRVLIVGAGGAARAVAYALAQAGSLVSVTARRPQQAESLARAVGGDAVPRAKVRGQFFDAIVNTTPVGMHPQENASPLSADELNTRLVFDLIYRPNVTKLMQLAQRRGIETVSGLDMFVAQGIAQWEIWTGRRAPAAPMLAAVKRALAAAAKPRKRK